MAKQPIITKISSTQNPDIKAVVRLHSAKGRDQQQRFLAEGTRTISTILDSGYPPIILYTTSAMLTTAQQLTSSKLIVEVADHVMKKISPLQSPSGLLALFSYFPAPDPSKLQSGLVLANISDPGNMGTLIRTAAAISQKSVVIVKGADPFSPKVVQATAGTIAQVKIFRWSWDELIQHKIHLNKTRLNKNNLQLTALTVTGGKHPQSIQNKNLLLVIGNEAHGIPEQWVRECDQNITLFMPGSVESLNAAVAGSIAAYLVWAQ